MQVLLILAFLHVQNNFDENQVNDQEINNKRSSNSTNEGEVEFKNFIENNPILNSFKEELELLSLEDLKNQNIDQISEDIETVFKVTKSQSRIYAKAIKKFFK